METILYVLDKKNLSSPVLIKQKIKTKQKKKKNTNIHC